MTAPVHTPIYNAQLVRRIDADTIVLRLDKDHGVEFTHPRGVRLLGVDAPERYTDAGKVAIAFVDEWLAQAQSTGAPWPFVVVGGSYDKYGRPLGTVYRLSDGANLNDDLLSSGNAVPMLMAAHFTI